MHNEFTAIFERDGEWYIAKDEARRSLSDAIALILQDRREIPA